MKSVEDNILRIIKNSSFSLTIEEVSQKIGITRQTASKYLFYLEARGDVKMRPVGTAKLYYIEGKRKC